MNPITVVETPEFLRRAKSLLDEEQRLALVNHMAQHYREGVLIEGTGGLRKMRFAREGEGKSGGLRLVYYFYNEQFPVFLITLYAKNERADITAGEKNELRKLSALLVATYAKKGR